MITLLLTAILTFFTVVVIQLCRWIPKNGFSFSGTCVNHFGEPYSCNVIDWIARALSPFALPAVIIIALICFGISKLSLRLLKNLKPKK